MGIINKSYDIISISDNFIIKNSDKGGEGIFANKSFERGDLVLLSYGPIIKKCSKYTIPIDYHLFLDPTVYDCPVRYVNHSCEPNCGIKNGVEIVSMKRIEEGEEITIDYAMIVYDFDYYNWEEDISCECKSEKCRGEIGTYKNLSKSLKEKYKGFISSFLMSAPIKKYG